MFSDDDEEVAPKSRGRRQASPKDSDDRLKDDDDDPSDLENDLFGGDGSDQEMGDAEPSRKVQTLDDEELDSADDLDADPHRRLGDRLDDLDDDLDELERDETSYEVDIGLHQLPQSSNDETYLLKIPQFISIAPQIFKPETFQAPKLPPDAAITPYTFATTAIRWRKSLKDPSKLESNSRIIEWSDGSFSLQIGSSKEGLYDLPTNPLISSKDREYNPAHDSFTFLAEPLANSRLVRFFSHASQSMGVVPAVDNVITDDIKQMVAARYKATQKRRTDDVMKQMELSYKIEDPEKARREAEALEREAERFRKKAEAALRNKEAEGANGYTRRSRKPFGGLNAGDLEEERYDRKGRGGGGYGKKYQEDEYDDGDDFIEPDPPSDEEEDIIDDSESEEEYESSRRKEKKKKKEKKKEKRRAREEEEEDSEPEAEFTDDGEEPRERAKSPGKKARSASVADDDDEDEGEHMKAPDRKRRKVVMEDSEEE
ncbi:hypothetical protein AA313_de0204965 [Arthrobotrys entomopaga]|nr:hypothetical protein AA313_de0204965 [Arthrobotrys entomopaga]